MRNRKLASVSTGFISLLCYATLAKPAVWDRSAAPDAEAAISLPKLAVDRTGCRKCHEEEVDGFARSKMSHSMRLAAREPAGSVEIPGTTITMFSDQLGSWQRLESGGSTSKYHVDYVIGSGTHASGYITNLGNHLFQSPVAFYRNRGSYGLAPGYETASDPDYTRPIAAGCVFCHAGSFNAVAGTENKYGNPPFSHLAIGCDRCHGSSTDHLARPTRDNIISPPHLERAARDSICEQCHLIGVARVLNPGKQFTDFKPGQRLEDTFTIYRNEGLKDGDSEFKVISHSEQLAISKCERSSDGKLWCGTCHDPHNEPTEPIAFYRNRCLLCHASTTLVAEHPPKTSNCIGCHMPQRIANDGGHTAFTDHRIRMRPENGPAKQATSIAAWREPQGELAKRNLGIASVQLGISQRSATEIVAGYRMLTEIQQEFPQDSEIFKMMGDALYLGKQYKEAVKAFELALRFDPGSSPKEASLAACYEAMGQQDNAVSHLEKAIEVDPLNLGAATELIALYEKHGDSAKAQTLAQRIAGEIKTTAEHPRGSAK